MTYSNMDPLDPRLKIDSSLLVVKPIGQKPTADKGMSFERQARAVLRLVYALIEYRSPAAAGRLYRFEEAWYRWRKDGGPLPQSKHFVTMLEHLHWARFHDFPFWMVQGLGPGGVFEPIRRRTLPPIPVCRNNIWDDPDRLYVPRIWTWISDSRTARNFIPFQVSDSNHRPAYEDHLTRRQWIRTLEMATWHVFGYKIEDIFKMDWGLRMVEWRHGRRPKPWKDFTENPMDILARADSIQI